MSDFYFDLMMPGLLDKPGVKELIEDFDLIPLSSPEAQAFISRFLSRDLIHQVDFSADLVVPSVYPDLLQMYAKHNSKRKRRSFGVSLDYQLKLF